MEYYVSKGKSGCTYGVHIEGDTYIQIEYPNGELENISKLENYSGWNLPRWTGQMGAEEVDKSKVPDSLLQKAQEVKEK